MIVGKGMMARAFASEFASDPQVVVFASGVSNSGETDAGAFARERDLLSRHVAENPHRLVYFSTCSIEDPASRSSRYVEHKLAMEQLARRAPRFLVFRLPQVVGRSPNPHTLANYLSSRIASGARFEIWENAWRDLIDVDDVARIGAHMIRDPAFWDRTVNIAHPNPIRVPDLVAIFERVLGAAANCDRRRRGERYVIDTREAAALAARLGIEFGDDYVERLIRKYYGTAHPRH